jgi:hypothetical protein
MYQYGTSSSEEASLLLLDSALLCTAKEERTHKRENAGTSLISSLPSIYISSWLNLIKSQNKEHTGEKMQVLL